MYSLAATFGFVVLAVGAQAPIAFIIAFVPVLLIAPEVAENAVVVTATGVGFIAIMTLISWRGLEIGERLQNVLLAVQYIALIGFVVAVIVSFATGTAPATATAPTLDWFNPFAFTSFDGFIQSVLLALFIYWGWDTCLALNEETRDPKRIPGTAAVLTTLMLLVTYVGVSVAAMAYAGLGADGLGNPGDGHLRRTAEAFCLSAPPFSHSWFFYRVDGGGGVTVFHRNVTHQRQPAARHDFVAGASDRLRPLDAWHSALSWRSHAHRGLRILCGRHARPHSRPFFRSETLNETTEVLVPDTDLPVFRSIDGGR